MWHLLFNKKSIKTIAFSLAATIFISSFSFLAFKTQPQIANTGTPLRSFKNVAFKRGETLGFRLHYGFMEAGIATLEVKEETKEFGARKTYHIVGTGTSKGAFDWFFKVRDRYETYIDEDALLPWLFLRRVNEGGYIINQNLIFYHYSNKVNSNGKDFDIPENMQDMVSAFYYTRCLDFSNAKPNELFTIPCFVDDQLFAIKIKYVGKETIKTDIGKFRCIKFRPVLQKGRIFKSEEDLNIWISDDNNHIPIRIEAKILVGSIKMDLEKYTGLANPISKIE